MIAVLLTSVRFLVLYAVLLAVFVIPPVQHATSGIVAWTGSQILRLCWGTSAVWSVSPAGIRIGSPTEWVELNALNQIRNVPLFWAIVLAVAPIRRAATFMLLMIASTALIVLDGIIVAGDAWIALEVPTNAAYHVVAAFNALHNTGGMFVAPTFIGAAAAVAMLNSGARPPQRARPNDACPCGSGVKFKRCCGT